jgi:hypothetical protein
MIMVFKDLLAIPQTASQATKPTGENCQIPGTRKITASGRLCEG